MGCLPAVRRGHAALLVLLALTAISSASKARSISVAHEDSASRVRSYSSAPQSGNETPSCPAEAAGGYFWPETQGGSSALVPCNPGQTGNGNQASRVCGFDGNWGAVQDYCNMMRCFGEIYGNANWYGAYGPQNDVQGECLSGFGGTPLRDCYANGQWGTTITSPCVWEGPPGCPAITRDNAYYNATPSGYVANGRCEDGYFGFTQLICIEDGVWASSATGIACTEYFCEGVVEDNAIWPSSLSGYDIHAVCVDGYSGGSLVRRCNYDKTWGAIDGTPCTENCQTVYEANTTWPSTGRGSSSDAVCDEGFYAGRSRECGEDGVWATLGEYDACNRIQCSGGYEGAYNATWEAVGAPASNVAGTCAYPSDTAPTRDCKVDGTWGDVTGACVPRRCPAVTTFHATWAETDADSFAQGTCDPGYFTDRDAIYLRRKCEASGEWETVSAVCEPEVLYCPAVTEGGATWPLTEGRDIVTFPVYAYGQCLEGTAGSGMPPRRMCHQNGTWTAIEGACTGGGDGGTGGTGGPDGGTGGTGGPDGGDLGGSTLGSLGGGAIAGIVIGSVAALGIAAAATFFIYKHKLKASAGNDGHAMEALPSKSAA